MIIRATARRDKAEVYAWCPLGTTATLPLLFLAGFLPGLPKLPQVLAIIALIGLPRRVASPGRYVTTTTERR